MSLGERSCAKHFRDQLDLTDPACNHFRAEVRGHLQQPRALSQIVGSCDAYAHIEEMCALGNVVLQTAYRALRLAYEPFEILRITRVA